MNKQAQARIIPLALAGVRVGRGGGPQCREKHSRAVSTTIWGMEVLGGIMRTEATLGPSSRQQSQNPKTSVILEQDPGSRWA